MSRTLWDIECAGDLRAALSGVDANTPIACGRRGEELAVMLHFAERPALAHWIEIGPRQALLEGVLDEVGEGSPS
jgi:hypothetical protein